MASLTSDRTSRTDRGEDDPPRAWSTARSRSLTARTRTAMAATSRLWAVDRVSGGSVRRTDARRSSASVRTWARRRRTPSRPSSEARSRIWASSIPCSVERSIWGRTWSR
ncbi:MAG TPA: hypothetical protein VHE80_09215 [Acidimicrobiales bacterium]|nr:hypothetical protein [Acidimicrobiales bacterium]